MVLVQQRQRFTGFLSEDVTIKTADESITEDTTLSNDSDLQFDVIAGFTYLIEGIIFVTSSAAPDFKYDMVFGSASPSRKAAGNFAAAANSAATSLGADAVVTMTQTQNFLRIAAYADITASGTWAFRWAQNTSSVSATVVKKDSYIRWIRIGPS